MKNIAGFLGATQYETNTVITTYLIANAMVLPLSGWLTKTLGQRNTLFLAISMFILGALLCVSTLNLTMLLIARAIQGVGGGALLPMCQAVLLSILPRSISVAVMLIIVGKFADKVDNRILIIIGLSIIGFGTFLFADINLSSSI